MLWQFFFMATYSISGMLGHDGSTKKTYSLRAGFEPAREDPIGFQVQRLNHSAITAPVHFARLNGVHSFSYYFWKIIIKAKGRKGNQFSQADDFTTDILPSVDCRWPCWEIEDAPTGDCSKPRRTAPFFFYHVFPLNTRPNPNILMLHLQKTKIAKV